MKRPPGKIQEKGAVSQRRSAGAAECSKIFADAGPDRTKSAAGVADAPGRPLSPGISRSSRSGGFLPRPVLQSRACNRGNAQPVRRFGFDAAIIFSDILVIPHALGQHVEFREGEGPHLTPVREEAALGACPSNRSTAVLSGFTRPSNAPSPDLGRKRRSSVSAERLGQLQPTWWKVAARRIKGQPSFSLTASRLCLQNFSIFWSRHRAPISLVKRIRRQYVTNF